MDGTVNEQEKGFPSWRYGPDGQRSIFDRSADVPEGWHEHPSDVPGAPDPSESTEERRPDRAAITKELTRLGAHFNPGDRSSTLWSMLKTKRATFDHDGDGKPGGPKKQEQTDELTNLRRAYEAKTGKKPFNGWNAAALREKLA